MPEFSTRLSPCIGTEHIPDRILFPRIAISRRGFLFCLFLPCMFLKFILHLVNRTFLDNPKILLNECYQQGGLWILCSPIYSLSSFLHVDDTSPPSAKWFAYLSHWHQVWLWDFGQWHENEQNFLHKANSFDSPTATKMMRPGLRMERQVEQTTAGLQVPASNLTNKCMFML